MQLDPEVRGVTRTRSLAALLPIALLGMPIALLAPDPELAAGGIAILMAFFALLWRPGESPILLFIVVYQWVQVNAKTFYGALIGVKVASQPSYGGDVVLAIILGNAAVLSLALGLRFGCGQWRPGTRELGFQQSSSIPMKVWLQLYWLAWIVSAVASTVAWIVPGLTQVLLAFSGLRWAALFILTYAAFARRTAWRLWWLVFGAEFLLTVGGFFAGFAAAIFYALFALVAVLYPFRLRRSYPLILVILLLFTSALAWTAVKSEYRAYVSSGSGAQIVLVDRQERLLMLGRMVALLEPAEILESFEQLMARIAYVDFFARVMEVVPALKPHEGGRLWGDALVRPLMPRLLFPSKTVVNDSIRTNEYTGLGVATQEQGTSISIGYVAEAYIDFGVPLMFLPILALGWGIGRFYRWLNENQRFRGVWSMALGTLALFPAIYFESSITKLMPALAVSMLTVFAVARFGLPRLLSWLMGRYLRRTKAKRSLATGSI